MKIISKQTSALIPYEHNAKIHDDTQIGNVAESIRRFDSALLQGMHRGISGRS